MIEKEKVIKEKQKAYKVAPGQILSSQKTGKLYREGDTIDLEHASNADISLLLSLGAIIEIEVK